ncbi:MAG: hypothetical protein P4L31_00565 [Candidatus Babeliales bacterium]|nr:hypothetical protein [Candidatus Babeliales bacterium]
MKRLIYILLFICSTAIHASQLDDFDVMLTPQWQDLESNEDKAKEFGGKWILAGSITFKKKAKDTVHLHRIYLQWNGNRIESLCGSLYKAESDRSFLPIQENLVCDGVWNKCQQTLMLNFDKKETLGFANTFNLVLTVPDDLEAILKTGHFNIIPSYLPEPFKMCARKDSLSLAFNTPASNFKKIEQPLKIAARSKK